MDASQLFEKLLEQLKLNNHPEYNPYLTSGTLEKVNVYKKSRKWEFILRFQDILPFEVYQELEDRLTSNFQKIAEVELVVLSHEMNVTSAHLEKYWQKAVVKSNVKSPAVEKQFTERYPVIEDRKIVFYLDNEVLVNQAQTQFFPEIERAYQSFGFPRFKLEARVDHDKAEENLAAFQERQEEMEVLHAKRAEETMNKQNEQKAKSDAKAAKVQLGRKIAQDEEIIRMGDILEEERQKTIEGYVFDVEVISLRSGRKLLQVKMTDYSSSFTVKKFSNNEDDEAAFEAIREGMWLRARGSIQEDTYMRDLVMMARDIEEWDHESRKDTAAEGEKRVELHMHSHMSALDATNTVSDYVAQAAKWGHDAVAITDHAVVQAFPEAMQAGRNNDIKLIYGMEAYVVNDSVPIAFNPQAIDLSEAEYVAFDVETTGLSAMYDHIIELAGVRMYKGNVIGTFEEFIDPGVQLSDTIINLTGITNDMLKGSKDEKDVLESFREFTDGAILVAHNATFDMAFLNNAYVKHGMAESSSPVIDTLELSRFLHPEFKSHRLNTLAKRYDVHLEQHHRAVYDSESTANLCHIFLKEAKEEYNITSHNELNNYTHREDAYKQARPFHVNILTKDLTGLKNLFKLVSNSHIDHFYRTPRILRSELEEYREGLLYGTACSDGEVFDALLQKGPDAALEAARFYDFIEVQPKKNYIPLLNNERLKSYSHIEEVIGHMVDIGERLDKTVVATGNVHYLNPEDQIYRRILQETQMPSRQGQPMAESHFKSTNEMLEEFSFLGEEKAYEIVVANTQAINESIDVIDPIKADLYTPKIEGAEDEITDLTYEKSRELYGDDLPQLVQDRINTELTSIIGNGFAVIYLISQKLVHKSNDDGYLVGSRGSVGSSFVATMTGITEVNPLPPHYRCPGCRFSEFFLKDEVRSGFDLPEKTCPQCGTNLVKDGQNIPFETFLGFKGDKVPDIDLNFSGEYQAHAHAYTKVLFGDDYVFRAGTIGTIAERTAFGYVKAHERETNQHHRAAEVDRLSKGLVGVKRSTGQHPGGIVVVPDNMDVYDFTPIQYPADDKNSAWRTTHFDFHSIEDNILKLDILGHDDPTHLKLLEDLTGIEAKNIPLSDPDVMKIFGGTEVLGVTEEQIFSPVGTYGVPEFGTPFVRQMLEQTRPSTFGELLQISGLSHGTDVYLGNAEVLIREHGMALSDVIGCRDDIMNDLIQYGLEDSLAFNIMEFVRKGRGIPDDWQAEMRANEVPEWYIQSCLKIKYMFPKAHAAAYIIMALRVAYFKVHMPIEFYASYFSVRASDFDLQAMAGGKEAVKKAMKEIREKGLDATNKEKAILVELEVANEMLERGFNFKMVDLDRSDAKKFIIDGNSIIAPFRAVPSLGAKAAEQLVQARAEQDFLSKEDIQKRGGVSKTVIEYLNQAGVLKGLPDENQLSLFDSL